MVILKDGVSDPATTFNLNGLDYKKGIYEVFYRSQYLKSDRTLDYDKVQVGVRNQTSPSNVLQAPVIFSEYVNSSLTPYASMDSLIADLATLLGFNNGGGLGNGIVISQNEDGYSDLAPGVNIGELAYVKNSEGNKWASAIGAGDYYPEGWYEWNGTSWESNRNVVVDQLQNILDNLDQEILDRQSGDNQISSDLSQEVTDRQNADASIVVDLTQEVADRQSGDTTLTNNLNQEIFDRQAGDTQLASDIAQEVTDRQNADTVITNDLNQEVSDRQLADTQLTSDINQEVADRQSADTLISNNLAQEILDRQNADTSLQNQVTLNDSGILDLQNNKRDITAQKNSIESDLGDLQLVGDLSAVPDNAYYGKDINGVQTFHKLPTRLIPNSGRFYLYNNNRWVTDSDDNYGTNYYQFNENCGTDADPLIEWEHKGIVIPPGKIIKALHFGGDCNVTLVQDLEIVLVLRTPNSWETGLSADTDDTEIVLYRDFFLNPAVGTQFTGNLFSTHNRTIELDQEVLDKSYLSIYLRPVGTFTGTRYFRSSYTWEIQ